MVQYIDLQLFAEGGDGGGASAAPAPASTGSEGGQTASVSEQSTTAVQSQPATGRGRKVNPLANVQYGIQPQAPTQEAVIPEGSTETFDDLINGRYKDEYGKRVQAAIQDRLKGSKEREAKIAPILEAMAQKYGLQADDYDGLSDAINRSRDEEAAIDQGISVETAAKIRKLEEAENARKAAEAQRLEEEQVQNHLNTLVQQGDQLKQIYPGFDLQAELQNPTFVRLTAPGVGVDVRTAYEVVHRAEMRGAEMQYAAQKSVQRVAASVAANQRRPAENGANGRAAAEVKSDPSKLTIADRKEIKRRVAMGEKIVF